MKLFAFAIGVALSSAAGATSDAALRFGAREDVQQISLSPDGKSIAYVGATAGRGTALYVAQIDGGTPKAIARSNGDPEQLRYCHWSTNTRLVCSIYIIVNDTGTLLGYSRVIAINADGKNIKLVSAQTTERSLGVAQNGGSIIDWSGSETGGSVLMTRDFVPERTTGTHAADTREGLGVEQVDTTSLKRNGVERPRGDAVEFITDGHGVVRMMGTQAKTSLGYDTNTIRYLYRKPESRDWLPFGTLALQGGQVGGFNPYAVDRSHNLVYGFDDKDGRAALWSVSLDGSLTRNLILARPDVDIDNLIRIGRQNRVVGATFVTDKRQAEFFDPELKKLSAALSKALPGLPLVTFVDASADESKLLLFAGSDVDPGRYYLFDKATRHLGEVLPARFQLAQTPLAAVKPITFAAADGTQIPAYLTLPPGSTGKNLPTIVMPHGGPSARDEWGFDWLAQFFANRGYAVLQPNYRGSTGYGDAWFKDNGFKSWRTAIGDVNDGGHWLVTQGIADPNKLAIVGWSYGGYAALQSAVLDPTLFKAIVAIAPVTDLESWRREAQNFTNYGQRDAFIGKGAHVVQGSPAQNAGRITAPVLIFHGDRDQNVGIGESRLMTSRLKSAGKRAELVEYKGLDHQLDDSIARAGMLDKADIFLRTSMGLPISTAIPGK